jgi:hypothetical protein
MAMAAVDNVSLVHCRATIGNDFSGNNSTLIEIGPEEEEEDIPDNMLGVRIFAN